ncbi:MAG: ABC transporter ATP-binding protein [Candidatus Bipolaricaulis sp.]|nr:ABC transporter ATP-binding protein [Candidatus Bipolaricaulis sp.]MDD5645890.1 ABC transporter ATP-binding protein [Candidatus Bipolaricaulis sp.]
MAGEQVVRAEGLRKRFGSHTALDGLSLSVPQGQLYGLAGPNGAGKTTLIRTLCGLLRPDEGEAHLLGWRMPNTRVRSQLGYMPQDFAVYDDLSVIQNLEFFGELYGLHRAHVRGRADGLLDLVQLADRRRDRVGSLSGGMRRRVSLAISLLHKPRLAFLDEPTAGVDPKLRRSFWDYFSALAEQDVTLVVTTHLVEEAQRCHRVGFLMAGRLLTEGTPDEILAQTGKTNLDDAFIELQERREVKS